MQDQEHDEKSTEADRASIDEDVSVLDALCRIYVDKEKGKGAETTESHEVSRGEWGPVEYDGGVWCDERLPGSDYEEAGHGEP